MVFHSFQYKGHLTGLLRQWRTRSTQQREGMMNTINVVNEINEVVTYNEAEVLRFVNSNTKLKAELSGTLYKVRDFFSESEWEDSATTFTRSEVNTLLRSIGADPIRGKWSATINITATVTNYEAEDEDDAFNCIQDDISVDIGSSADISVDLIEVSDLEADE